MSDASLFELSRIEKQSSAHKALDVSDSSVPKDVRVSICLNVHEHVQQYVVSFRRRNRRYKLRNIICKQHGIVII